MKYETAQSLDYSESMEARASRIPYPGYGESAAARTARSVPAAPGPVAHTPMQNSMLAALPAEDFARLRPQLELVALPLDLVLFGSRQQSGHGYFPTTSIVSRRYLMENGSAASFGITGKEGLVGIPLLMGGDSTPTQMVVQSAGYAYRVKADALKVEFERGGALQKLVLRYMQATITQIGQSAVCNGQHSIEQRLCRWLLLSLDRMTSNKLCMTQQQIADILGVRRESITVAEKELHKVAMTRSHRGCIVVHDRSELEARACECYEIEAAEFGRLLPGRLAN
jgi:CRP-like cAMP-binding protein